MKFEKNNMNIHNVRLIYKKIFINGAVRISERKKLNLWANELFEFKFCSRLADEILLYYVFFPS